jgi:hypothetical protein
MKSNFNVKASFELYGWFQVLCCILDAKASWQAFVSIIKVYYTHCKNDHFQCYLKQFPIMTQIFFYPPRLPGFDQLITSMKTWIYATLFIYWTI